MRGSVDQPLQAMEALRKTPQPGMTSKLDAQYATLQPDQVRPARDSFEPYSNPANQYASNQSSRLIASGS